MSEAVGTESSLPGGSGRNGSQPLRTVPLAAPQSPSKPAVIAGPLGGLMPGSLGQPPAAGRSARDGPGEARWWQWRRRQRDQDHARRSWIAMARTPLAAPLRATVASPTGGVGKTTIALGLGQVLAGLRAERVAVLDAEPLGGTAALRVRAQPGRGLPALLWDLDRIERQVDYSTWARYGDVEHETRLTVFGRREPLEGIELDANLYYPLVHALARHWPIVVVDTGRPEGRAVLQAQAVDSADVLVVVCGSGRPTVGSVAGWLRNVRVPAQHRVGVVVTRPGGDVDAATALLQAETSAVVHVPMDKALDADASVPFMVRTTPRTRDAFLELAALVMHTHAGRTAREEQKTP